VSLLVDTSVWSLAFRRDAETSTQAVEVLRSALEGADQVFTTGLILQELLQGFSGPKARDQLIERFAALALLLPDREDHIEAAEIRNACRRNGVQIGTVDAVLIQLCLRHDLILLSADNDFRSASKHIKFRLWSGAA
jgi:predicted nucleic acid-binding protein